MNTTGKIIKLDISEELLEGMEVDALSFVEYPAIEQDWYAFNNVKEVLQSYTDYPQAAVDNAKLALKIRIEEPLLQCGTRVGWARANQLSKREPISEETIARMASFVRQKQNSAGNPRRDCGALMWLAWGGTEGIEWAQKKLERIRFQSEFIISDIDGTLLDENNQPIETTVNFLKNQNLPIIVISARYIDRKEETLKQLDTLGLNIAEVHLNDFGDGYQAGVEFKRFKIQTLMDEGYKIAYVVENTPSVYEGIDVEVIDVKDITSELETAIIDGLKNIGITEQDILDDGYEPYSAEEFENRVAFALITSNPNQESIDDFGTFKILYRYTGPQDSKNRSFCSQVLGLNLLFRKEDINKLTLKNANKEFGSYDIFRYKGSYNCRHYWERLIYRKSIDVEEAARPLAIDTSRVMDATTVNNKAKRANQPAAVVEAFSQHIKDKQMIIAPIMRANHLILRYDEQGNPYHVYFTADTVQKIAHKFLKKKYTDSINIDHNPDHFVDDVFLVESWVVEDPKQDKSSIYGYKAVAGDWYGLFKVDNTEVWEDYVKTGLVKGISVEGYFIEKLIGQK